MITIAYNNIILSAAPYNVTGYDGYSMPTRTIQSLELTRQDGAIEVSQRMGSRTITVDGQIKTETKAELIAAIDTLKSNLYRPKGSLVVTDEDEVTRTWQCTPQNVAIVRTRGDATQANYSIQFYSPKPYSSSYEAELLSTNVTTQPINIPIQIAGTYPAQPIITLTINSITAGEQTINVGNQSEDRSISITGTFEADDQIVIDTQTRDVFVNTIRSDYSGTFPRWAVGGGSLYYTDTAAARDIDIVMTYKVRNL